MSSPIDIVLEMITMLFRNTIGTLLSILDLLKDLFASFGAAGSSGVMPFMASIAFLGIVLFFFGKFFISSLKTLVLLFLAGFAILLMLFGFL